MIKRARGEGVEGEKYADKETNWKRKIIIAKAWWGKYVENVIGEASKYY